MRRLARILNHAVPGGAAAALLAILIAGCAGPRGSGTDLPPMADSSMTGLRPAALEFLYVFENSRDAPYFPIEGIAAVAYAPDGTLFFCDEKGGRVHGYAPERDRWFQLDRPHGGNFRPLDLAVDGFTLLVLDFTESLLLRYDLRGVLQDRLISFKHIDPGFDRRPSALDADSDGRLVFTDVQEQQVFLLDSFLDLNRAIGEPGSHREQFRDPSGIAFLPDGGFLVADRGNRRLQRFNRLGYFEGEVGGEFDPHNALLAPQGLDCDRDGNVFVADPVAGVIHVYSAGLRPLFRAGNELGLLGAPQTPVDAAVGPDDLLAVSDRGRQAVIVYRIVYE